LEKIKISFFFNFYKIERTSLLAAEGLGSALVDACSSRRAFWLARLMAITEDLCSKMNPPRTYTHNKFNSLDITTDAVYFGFLF